MIYELHEFQAASVAPLRQLYHAAVAMNHRSFGEFGDNALSRMTAALADLVLRTTHRYDKPEFRLTETTVNGQPVRVSERVVLEKPFCRLLRFERETAVQQPIVLVVAPLSGHHATLLRDTVRALLPDHDVHITDWVDARLVPLAEGPFHFDDYVAYLLDFIHCLGPDVHVISVCQPTVPTMVAISFMAAEGERLPRSMTLMGGPIDPRQNPTAVNAFTTGKTVSWFENNVIARVPSKYPGASRLVYPGFLQLAGFASMNAKRHFDSHRDYFHDLVRGDGESAAAHRKFYDEFNAVMDLPAEYYLDTIRMVFIEHQLPLGQMAVLGRPVNPALIRDTALLTIEGELDDISGRGQTQAAHTLCTNIPAANRQHLTVDGVGHYGIFSGQRFRERVYPQLREFIARFA